MRKNVIITEQQLGGLVNDLINMALTGFTSDEKKDDTSNGGSTGTAPTDFKDSVNKIIDNLEGGYYHPDMLRSGKVSGNMGNSGETMMGMDRIRGSSFAETPAGVKFWGLIDDANARQNWKYNYMGGSLEPQLRDLVAEMIKPEFERLSKTYLSSEAQKIVKDSPELTFNFVYATWNGSGWFQKFARKINDAVEDGIKNPDELIKIAIDTRKESGNSFIAKSGDKISKILSV
jgi:hypothetical protein